MNPLPLLLLLVACDAGVDDPKSMGETNETDETETLDPTETDETEPPDTDDSDVLVGPTLIVLANASFEDQDLDAGTENFQERYAGAPVVEVPGWSVAGLSFSSTFGVTRPSVGLFPTVEPLPSPAAGNHALYFDARDADGVSGQSRADTTSDLGRVEAGRTYTLTVAVGHRSSGTLLHDELLLAFTADGQQVASVAAALPAAGTWADSTLTWTPDSSVAGQALGVRLVATTAQSASIYYQTYVDNVRLTVE